MIEVISCSTKRVSLQSSCLCSLNSMMLSGSPYFGGSTSSPCSIALLVVFAGFAKTTASLFRGAPPHELTLTSQCRFRGPGL
jgi:hypothetical protein